MDARSLVDMDYVACDELGNLSMRFVLDVEFTYVVGVSSTHLHISKHVQRTRDDVPDSWTWIVCRDGIAVGNLNDSCQ